MLKFQVTASKSPHPQILPSGKTEKKRYACHALRKDITPSTGGFLKALEPGEHGGGERGGYGKEAGAVRRREKALKPGREELRVGAGKKREGSRGGGRARLRGKGRGGLLSRGLRRGCGSACKTKKQRAIFVRRPVGNKVLALFYFPT